MLAGCDRLHRDLLANALTMYILDVKPKSMKLDQIEKSISEESAQRARRNLADEHGPFRE